MSSPAPNSRSPSGTSKSATGCRRGGSDPAIGGSHPLVIGAHCHHHLDSPARRGAEAYLDHLLPELHEAGHTLDFWCEVDAPQNRDPIRLPDGVACCCVADVGAERALAALRHFAPNLLYCHGLLDPQLEERILGVAPAVFLAHNYYGTCISGTKTWSRPAPRPCARTFGPACLLHYYPHRCGGWNPVTMVRDYRLQQARLGLMRRYQRVLTFSQHMNSEMSRHGLASQTISCLVHQRDQEPGAPGVTAPRPFVQLVFVGRMEPLKGGSVLLAALPLLRARLDRPLRLILAGDGPARHDWQTLAATMTAANPGISVEFPGWVAGTARDVLLARSDLLVVPSLWPEPFGMVGPEAGRQGVPAAAFAVGGIREWLHEGVNGHLAPGDPPTPTGLAAAILRCLGDGAHHAVLRQGAIAAARRYSAGNHVRELLAVFEQIDQNPPVAP